MTTHYVIDFNRTLTDHAGPAYGETPLALLELEPNVDMCGVVRTILASHPVTFVTGHKDLPDYREATEQWLQHYVVRDLQSAVYSVMMRPPDVPLAHSARWKASVVQSLCTDASECVVMYDNNPKTLTVIGEGLSGRVPRVELYHVQEGRPRRVVW